MVSRTKPVNRELLKPPDSGNHGLKPPLRYEITKVLHNEYERRRSCKAFAITLDPLCYATLPYLESSLPTYPHSDLSYRFQPAAMKITISSLHLSGQRGERVVTTTKYHLAGSRDEIERKPTKPTLIASLSLRGPGYPARRQWLMAGPRL